MSSKYLNIDLNKSKYLKYKAKYLNLKKIFGAGNDPAHTIYVHLPGRVDRSVYIHNDEKIVSAMIRLLNYKPRTIQVSYEDNIFGREATLENSGINHKDIHITVTGTVNPNSEFKNIERKDWEFIINKMLDDNNITTKKVRDRIIAGQTYKKIDGIEFLNNIIITNVYITKLPDEFGNFILDGNLTIQDTALTKLPNNFGNIKIGGFLNLSCNMLTSLPENFANIEVGYNESLSKDTDSRGAIHLYGNVLRLLPENFGEITLEGDLLLYDNEIICLPDTFGNLQIYGDLSLRHNNLTDLPPTFKNIEVSGSVYLDKNLFEKLPICLKEINQNHNFDDVDENDIPNSYTIKGKIVIGHRLRNIEDDLFDDNPDGYLECLEIVVPNNLENNNFKKRSEVKRSMK